jgi:hypothetical protein
MRGFRLSQMLGIPPSLGLAEQEIFLRAWDLSLCAFEEPKQQWGLRFSSSLDAV